MNASGNAPENGAGSTDNPSHTEAGKWRPASQVLPVSASRLIISRGARTLLSIDDIVFDGTGCTAIIGPNGSGKSLLVHTLAGLRPEDGATVRWQARRPDRMRRHRVGLLLQRPVLFRRSARANLEYALRAAGRSRIDARVRADAALSAAGLAGVGSVSALRLSGGEQQRLALARALCLEPELLFLDEPTASVDPVSTVPIEARLRQATTEGVLTVLVSHDLGQVRRLADEVILMHRGRIVERAPCEQFFATPATPEARAFIAGELLL